MTLLLPVVPQGEGAVRDTDLNKARMESARGTPGYAFMVKEARSPKNAATVSLVCHAMQVAALKHAASLNRRGPPAMAIPSQANVL